MINSIIIIISHDEKLQYDKNCSGCFERGTGSIKLKIMNIRRHGFPLKYTCAVNSSQIFFY